MLKADTNVRSSSTKMNSGRPIKRAVVNTLVLLNVILTASITLVVLEARLEGDIMHGFVGNDGNQYAWATTFPGNNGKLAFSSDRTGHEQIFTMNPDGTNETNISDSNVTDAFPNWSPNGTKIAFSSDRDRDGYQEIYVMNANGTNPFRLTNNTAQEFSPNFAPVCDNCKNISNRPTKLVF